jgi:hypothetical protein
VDWTALDAEDQYDRVVESALLRRDEIRAEAEKVMLDVAEKSQGDRLVRIEVSVDAYKRTSMNRMPRYRRLRYLSDVHEDLAWALDQEAESHRVKKGKRQREADPWTKRSRRPEWADQ